MSRHEADVRFPPCTSQVDDTIVDKALPVYAAAPREQPGAMTSHAHGWKPATLATHVKIIDGRIVGAHSVARLQWNAVVRSARANSGEQPSLGRMTTTGSGELEVLAFAVAGCAAAEAGDVLVVLNEPHHTGEHTRSAAAPVRADGDRSATCAGQFAFHGSASLG